MARPDVVKIAATVAALQPQLAVLMQAVQYGIIGVQAVRLFFQKSGQDDATCDAIVAECDRQIAKWQNAKF